MAQTLGTAITQPAAMGTSLPVAASFAAQSAADGRPRQTQAGANSAPATGTAQALAAAAENDSASPPVATQAVIDSINASFMTGGKSLQLSVDSESERSILILRDTETGAVIGQFPTEEVLRLQSQLDANPHILVDLTA